MDGVIAYYKTKDEAEEAARKYRLTAKVKTDVFRVKESPEGFYVEQDVK